RRVGSCPIRTGSTRCSINSTTDACVSEVNAGTGHASPYPTWSSSVRTTSTTLGDVLRSVVPKRNVRLNDTARGTASTETIFNVTPQSSAHAELGVLLLGLDAGVAESGQVDGLVVAGQQVLG